MNEELKNAVHCSVQRENICYFSITTYRTGLSKKDIKEELTRFKSKLFFRKIGNLSNIFSEIIVTVSNNIMVSGASIHK